MPKRIPIAAVRKFAQDQACKQVIVAAWDGESTHITTYGISIEDCAQAAEGGNKIKAALGWPKSLDAEPSRVRKLLERIKELEGRLDKLQNPPFATSPDEW